MTFITIYSQAVLADADNGVTAGTFIPIADLPGVSAGEFADNQSEILKEGKAIYGLVNAIYSKLAPISTLGIINLTKSNPSGTGPNRFTESLSLTFQWVGNYSNRTIYPVPLPTMGTENGKGKVAIQDIFPNATLVSAEGAISGEGVLFSHLTANQYGSETPSTVTVDARDWVFSLIHSAIALSTLRTSTVSSAITNRTNLLTNRVTGVVFPAVYYDSTNPTSGILAADLSHLRLIENTLNIEYEVESFPVTQTQEIRVAVT